MKRCAWHECNREFEPTDPKQKFCCPECRIARSSWTAYRGGQLVNLLLAGDAAGLLQHKRKLEREIEDAKRNAGR